MRRRVGGPAGAVALHFLSARAPGQDAGGRGPDRCPPLPPASRVGEVLVGPREAHVTATISGGLDEGQRIEAGMTASPGGSSGGSGGLEMPEPIVFISHF